MKLTREQEAMLYDLRMTRAALKAQEELRDIKLRDAGKQIFRTEETRTNDKRQDS